MDKETIYKQNDLKDSLLKIILGSTVTVVILGFINYGEVTLQQVLIFNILFLFSYFIAFLWKKCFDWYHNYKSKLNSEYLDTIKGDDLSAHAQRESVDFKKIPLPYKDRFDVIGIHVFLFIGFIISFPFMIIFLFGEVIFTLIYEKLFSFS